MRKVTIELSDRLAEAVNRYDIPLDEVAGRAIEADVATRLPVARFNPQTRDILQEAAVVAEAHGHEYVGVEHLFLAILLDDETIPTQVLTVKGVRETLIADMRQLLTMDWEVSNRVVDNAGNVLGFLVYDEDGKTVSAIRPDGKPVQIVRGPDGNSVAFDAEGQPLPPLSPDDVPLRYPSADEDHRVG